MRGFGRVALDLVEIRKAYRNGVKTTIVHPNAINTGMFDGIKLRLQWLVPMLEPRDVAEAVIDAALAGKVHMMDRSRCVRPDGERERERGSLERCIDCTWRSLVFEQESVVLPWIVARTAPFVRIMPNMLRDSAMDLFGASTGMESFVGRSHEISTSDA